MKYLSLFLTVTALFAVDIHAPGRVEYFTPAVDVNPDFIGFSNGYTIDTRIGEPNLPANLRIDGYDGAGYYLLQVKGPVYSEWLDALKNLGIDVIVYIPNYSFIVYADQGQIDQARAKDFVKWTGIYQPAFKLEKELLNARGTARVALQLFPTASVASVRRIIESQGYPVVLTTDNELCKTVEAIVDLGNISTLARIPDVQWIQRWSEPTLVNSNSQWVCMTGYKASGPGADSVYRRSWTKGVIGRGVVLSLTDSGITTAHLQFYDAAYPITAPGVFPNHRKIVAYKNYTGAVFGDNANFSWHGTHTDGTTAGNDTLLGPSVYDGIAKEARLYFVDIGSDAGLVVSTDLTPMYDTVYLGRGLPYQILQHSGSWGWGNSSGTYLLQDASTDAYAYKYPRLLNIYAAGNEYNAMTLRNPGISKNSITVGATGNGTVSNTIAGFSSRGPTQDNRIKPNLCAPGDVLYSAAGGSTNQYASLSGTSMATPSVNGTIGLMRQYLLAGYYPTGAARAADSIRYISANLLRAMAIVSTDPNVGAYVPPSFDMGWGRIDAESVLFYTGDARKLIIKDDTVGVTTGQSRVDSFNVNSGIPLRICVVWTDTAAAPSATRTLVNNINVQLTAPGGTFYRGNLYTGGVSTANPATWDTTNVEECFRVNAPATGRWRLTVTGQNIPNGPMGFAYAITGDISPIVGIEENTNPLVPIEKVIFNPITNGRILLKVSLAAKGRVEARLIDLTGRIVETIARTDLPAGESVLDLHSQLPSGVYFLEVKTSSAHKIGKLLIVR
jgi:subtilisin family serine protease